MARKTYRKRFFKKAKWAANIQEFNYQGITAVPGSFSGNTVLTTNPTQNTLGVSQIYTVKNFDINFTIEAQDQWLIEAVTVYIMYVPQGMTITDNYNIEHPEYIMNYKYLGSASSVGTSTSQENQQYQPYRVRTRMARKLNTGDSIVLFVKGFSQGTANLTLNIAGIVRWWTKAN